MLHGLELLAVLADVLHDLVLKFWRLREDAKHSLRGNARGLQTGAASNCRGKTHDTAQEWRRMQSRRRHDVRLRLQNDRSTDKVQGFSLSVVGAQLIIRNWPPLRNRRVCSVWEILSRPEITRAETLHSN